MNYGSLSAAQQAQVEFLFADHLFDSDPAAFDYQIDLHGLIWGRSRLVHLRTDARGHL